MLCAFLCLLYVIQKVILHTVILILQSAFSTVCGQYCIYFLYHRCRKRTMTSIVNSFVNDKLRNDQLVYDFVRRKYRQIHPSLKQVIVKQISRSLYRN